MKEAFLLLATHNTIPGTSQRSIAETPEKMMFWSSCAQTCLFLRYMGQERSVDVQGTQDIQTRVKDMDIPHMALQLTRGGVFSKKRLWEQL